MQCAPPSLTASPQETPSSASPSRLDLCLGTAIEVPHLQCFPCQALTSGRLSLHCAGLTAAWFGHVSTLACSRSCVGGHSGFPSGCHSTRVQNVLGVHVRACVWGAGVEWPGHAELFSEVATPADHPPAARAEPVTRGGSAVAAGTSPTRLALGVGRASGKGLAGAGGSVVSVLLVSPLHPHVHTACVRVCVSSASQVTWGDYVCTCFF